ncbi:MAG TPA: cyclic pyranopterin monophosphate synthase MoaC [Thermoanaerobaculia bacterium]|nr:cyclic pyranopterin monophosphate synthase MoaC [Thermoanaerobaculia bacterium]
MTAPFSHLDAAGEAHMVDVSGKPVTRRVAAASCFVRLLPETVARLGALPKGDAFAVARVAGIQGAKRTGELVPLAHPLPLDQVEVELVPRDGTDGGPPGVAIAARVVVTARTGAELEALAACAAAALALYDMVKAVDRGATITDLALDAKSGGRSGDWRRGTGGAPAGEGGR